jgi:hypothetical protein
VCPKIFTGRRGDLPENYMPSLLAIFLIATLGQSPNNFST